jgi:hypothetical protein
MNEGGGAAPRLFLSSVCGHLFVGVALPVPVSSVFARSWEDLALDSAPRLADVLFWIFAIAPAVAIDREN